MASFSCTFQEPDTIIIDETWTGKANPYIKISNLDPGETYKIEKTIRNLLPASETMKAIGHELHDPDNGPGSQMTAAWLIPVIVSAIGIGIVIARKF